MGERLHFELRWHQTKGTGKLAAARLFAGADSELNDVIGTIVCAPEVMNMLDRMLKEGALDVQAVTYLGRELREKELGSW